MYKLITICFGTGCAQTQCCTSHCTQTVHTVLEHNDYHQLYDTQDTNIN